MNSYLRKNGFQNIEEVQKSFERISNFFPAFNESNFLKPSYKSGEFYLEEFSEVEFSEVEFRLYFVDTFVQTAVEPVSRKAKDKSLHEIDYLLPRPKNDFYEKLKRKGFKDNLYWMGIIYLDSDRIENFIEKGLKIYVGADIRYGYGELELVNKKELKDSNDTVFQIENNKVKIAKDKDSLYFIPFSNDITFEGEIELLGEFDFTKNKPKMTDAKFYLSVGSKITKITKRDNILGDLKKGKVIFNNF
ncbi:hypothetical protein V4762_02805 [Thermodesulfobium sp. 4217-1]|uniref:hypothetical protein n=1 Tax=Thermodesulfobium sp. 4217-1 TaxID=3120013 RepID=UPI003221B7DB